MATLDRILSSISDFSKAMGTLHGDFLRLVRRDIERFKELTNNVYDQMQWQSWTVIGLSSLSATLGIVGSLIPKGAVDPTTAPLNNPRLGVNDGMTDAVSNTMKWISEQLRNSDFLRTTAKSTAKFFTGVTPATDAWFRSQTTKLESDRELMRLLFQEGQQEKGVFSNETRRVQETALSILQSKKGN